MFILSEEQFGGLLQAGGFQTQRRRHGQQLSMLDIGAGDGEVTQRLVNSVHQLTEGDLDNSVGQGELRVFATEYSYTMRKRLQKKNYM